VPRGHATKGWLLVQEACLQNFNLQTQVLAANGYDEKGPTVIF
jgi:hypothetical protein